VDHYLTIAILPDVKNIPGQSAILITAQAFLMRSFCPSVACAVCLSKIFSLGFLSSWQLFSKDSYFRCFSLFPANTYWVKVWGDILFIISYLIQCRFIVQYIMLLDKHNWRKLHELTHEIYMHIYTYVYYSTVSYLLNACLKPLNW
jgi:hypothetical protein